MKMVKNHFCDSCSLGQVDRKRGQRIRRLNLLHTLLGGTFATEVPTTSFGREHRVLSITAQAWGIEVSGNIWRVHILCFPTPTYTSNWGNLDLKLRLSPARMALSLSALVGFHATQTNQPSG